VRCNNGTEEQALRARWVVGCDGMHSVIREMAGIPFTGGAYEESFVLADVEMDWPLGREEVTLFFSEQTKAATLASPAAKSIRNAVISILGHVPLAQHAIARKLAELDRR